MYRIFIVDDNRRVVTALTELLAVFNDVQVVGCASSEISAVEWLVLQHHEWDFAVVDLALRSGSGLRVLSACRVRQGSQKVAVLGNQMDSTMRRKCETFGADAAFEKETQIELAVNYCIAVARKKL